MQINVALYDDYRALSKTKRRGNRFLLHLNNSIMNYKHANQPMWQAKLTQHTGHACGASCVPC